MLTTLLKILATIVLLTFIVLLIFSGVIILFVYAKTDKEDEDVDYEDKDDIV